MKPAVAYMRFSSHGQKETSIEGQRMVINEFAKREGYTILKEYIDRALTGTNDQRPEFQKMIRDSAKHQFEAVLVYQLDRFARDRYDSAINKHKLKANGVKVVSARENISDDASGVLMEAVLEGMAEYYSKELSQKIKRGISLKIAECKHIGGIVPLGYKLTEDKKYVIDPVTAPLVEKCFKLYAANNTLKSINQAVTDEYGKEFFGNACNSLNRILSNRNYIGFYTRGEKEVKDGVPRIVSDELFERVQQMRGKNKKTPAKARAHEEYLLTTKLYCGHCKERIKEDVFMVGVSGTSKTGAIHNYYTCKNVWKKKGCDKKNVKKAYIEDFILSLAREQLTDDNIAVIAKAVSEISKKENNTAIIAEIKKKLKENESATENLLKAIESGEHIDLLSERITRKKQEREALENALAREQWEKTELDETEIEFFLSRLKNGDIEDIKYKRAIISVFINAVYLYDDRTTIIFNTTDKSVTVDYDFILEKMGDNAGSCDNKRIDAGSYMTTASPSAASRRTQ